MEKPPSNFKPRPKVYGEKAVRIERSDFDNTVAELLEKFGAGFTKLQPTEQLDDKDSFGDIDFVCLPKRNIDERYFREVIGRSLLEYKRMGHVHSLLVRLDSGRQIQVDFIQSKDREDFERKFMYYSKGHTSSIVGILAKKLRFKYGTDGFFKRFKDKRGNWHDILISGSLIDGLKILGLEPEDYKKIRNLDDIANFVSKSPFFDGSFFQSDRMVRRDRESAERNPREKYVIELLAKNAKKRETEDEDEFFKKFFPAAYRKFQKEAERINKETYAAGNINGKKIMETFGVKPGPIVGKILKFIGDRYPDAEDLSSEIIDAVKMSILKQKINL